MSPVLVGTFGRTSGIGAIKLIRKKIIHPHSVLVGAPTNLNIATRGPGFANVEITLPISEQEKDYLASHNVIEASVSQSRIFTRAVDPGASSDISDNPIMKLIEYLSKMPEGIALISVDAGVSASTDPDYSSLEVDLVDQISEGVSKKLIQIAASIRTLAAEFKSVEDEMSLPKFSTITLGTIRSYPEEIKIAGVCRLVPADRKEVYENWLEKLRQECDAVGATFKMVDYKPPFDNTARGPLTLILNKVLENMGMTTQQTSAHRSTEANVFQRFGVESVVFGPGEVLKIKHNSMEHVRESDLEIAEKVYTSVIEAYCK